MKWAQGDGFIHCQDYKICFHTVKGVAIFDVVYRHEFLCVCTLLSEAFAIVKRHARGELVFAQQFIPSAPTRSYVEHC